MEDYEGSRTEYMKMLADHDGPPAYVLRAQRVEVAWESLLTRCRKQQQELLPMPKTRLAQVAALIDGRWELLGAYLSDDSAPEYFRQLHDEWKPSLRVKLEPTDSQRKIRAALKDLHDSLSRFNRRWETILDEVSLANVNFERSEYNNYYLVEKAAALGSERLAAMGWERLPEVTLEDLKTTLPPLRLPVIL